MDDEHELDDPDLSALLRRDADRITGRVDTEAALQAVQQRARTRRRWRAVTASAAAVAAAAVVVVAGSAVLDRDSGTVRTPAAPVDGVATAPAPTPIPSTSTPVTSPVTTAPPASVVAAVPSLVAASLAPTTVVAATPATSPFASRGGSIVVGSAGGTIALVGDPSPSEGWTYRIDDDGPERVRVRFELAGQRSEIRVELRDGRLVPEIIEQ